MKRTLLVLSLLFAACHHEHAGTTDDLGDVTVDAAIHPAVDAATGDLAKVDPCAKVDCGDHGKCVAKNQKPRCQCDDGWIGDACDACDTAAGWIDDGAGGCKHDPCNPNPCTADKPICSVASGAASCGCEPGKHLEGDNCITDTTCLPTSCSGHGDCVDATGSVVCTCATGYTGAACTSCDTGYHSDGAGGCTNDPCQPNPCTSDHQSKCAATSDGHSCACDDGYHLAGLDCVLDETCTSDTCHSHGTCAVASGVAACTCGDGYTGTTCTDCAGGYHSDGAGGCTNDPCLPSPCTTPHKSMCTPVDTTTASCACDDGYHADGADGCTTDPCTPNLCAAQNQACRVNMAGMAECYTPPCDDMNPCTTDTLEGGVCKHKNLDDGTTCSTTLCLVGQTCQTGACAGGTAKVCNDNNPCTKNECDPVTGCKYSNDNTLVPDDGKDCTVDKCSNGVASHSNDDSVCKDDLYCNGSEICSPSAGGADARGCLHQNVPAPPALAPNDCAHYVCDESSDSFTLVKTPAGTACNDGLVCTTSDKCQSDGACRGSVNGSCNLSCGGASPLPGTVDLPSAIVTGKVLLNGSTTLPTSTGGSDIYLYLVDPRTGARMPMHYATFSTSTYPYSIYDTKKTFTTTVMPGVYDLLYARGVSSTTAPITTYLTSAGDNYPDGYRFLQKSVVIGPGANTVDVDIPTATLAGKVRLNGSETLPTSTGGSDIYVYLVDPATGARTPIHYATFSTSTYPYAIYDSKKTYTTTVLPGTYDVLYARGVSSTSPFVTTYLTSAGDNYPDGYVYLKRNFTVSAGANSLDIDIPTATLAGKVRLNGSETLPTSTGGSDIYIYLVDPATGARIPIHYATFSTSSYPYSIYDSKKSYTTTVLPGTYDVLYARGVSSTSPFVTTYLASAGDNYPDGYSYLKKGLVIGAGANTFDIDIPSTTVSGKMKLNGDLNLPTSTGGSDVYLYLVDQATGARTPLHYMTFSTSSYPYAVYDSKKTYTTTIMPGTYDLLYARGVSSTSPIITTYLTSAGDNYPDGYSYLQRNVVIPKPQAGVDPPTLDIDIPARQAKGTISLNGSTTLPTSTGGSDVYLYLVDQATGARIPLHYMTFSTSSYPYTVYDTKKSFVTTVMPGTYDLLYARGVSSTADPITTYLSSQGDNYADGYMYLQKGIVIPAGAQPFSLDVNLRATQTGASLTLNGGPLLTSTGGSDVYLYFVDRETHARMPIHYMTFSTSSYPYTVYDSKKSFVTTVLPGSFDLLYARGVSSTSPIITTYLSSAGDNYADGYSYLGACVSVP